MAIPLIDYTLHDILLDDPKEAASIRRRSLHFYYDPTLKTLYRVHMTVSSSIAFLIQRHRKRLKKRTTVFAELISQVQNLKIGYTDLDIIGQL